jgi:hypothetical protein
MGNCAISYEFAVSILLKHLPSNTSSVFHDVHMDLANVAVPIMGPREPTATVQTDVILLVIVRIFVVYTHILSASTSRRVD